MSRIDLVSKNLLTSSFRNFSKKDVKKTALRNRNRRISKFPKNRKSNKNCYCYVKRLSNKYGKKIARTTNLTKFYTSWTYLYQKITFYCLWQCHYIYRWFIHPWIMKYSSPTTPTGIPLEDFSPMSCRAFSILIGLGQQITMPDYDKDPRFIIGIGLFVAGFIINRYADLSLIAR